MRAVVAGHIHRQEVVRVNGITSVTLPGILNTARGANAGRLRVGVD